MPERRLDRRRFVVRWVLAAALSCGAASVRADDVSPPGAVPLPYPSPSPLAVPQLSPTDDSAVEYVPPQSLDTRTIPSARNWLPGADARRLAHGGSPDGPDLPCTVYFDNGLVFATEQRGVRGSLPVFAMRINSWAQTRHTVFDSDGPNADANTFSFERLRLALAGHAYSPSLHYFVQLDGNSDLEGTCTWLDSFLTYDIGYETFGCREELFGLIVGKWKMPFSRARAETGRYLQFTDRATASVLFDVNRGIGVGLQGHVDALGRPLYYETAVCNGFNTGRLSTSRGEGLDRNFGWSGRLYTDFLSEFGGDGEPDLGWHRRPTLRIGAGAAYTRAEEEGHREYQRHRVVDSGEPFSDVLPAAVDGGDIAFFTVDAHLKCRGLSFIADYYWRFVGPSGDATVPDLFDHGFLLQTGYFIRPEKLELLVRWSRIVGDSGTLGLEEESSDEVAAGVAWYIRNQNAKLVFDATHLNGAPVKNSRLNVLPGDAGWLFRTQLQVGF